MELRPLSNTSNFGVFYYYLDDKNWLYVGNDPSSGWYCEYRVNGQGSYPAISGLPAPVAGEPMKISISLGRETLIVNVNGIEKKLTNQDFIKLSETINGNQDNSKFGVMTKAQTKLEFANVALGNDLLTGKWDLLNKSNGKLETRIAALVNVTGRVVNENNEPMVGATIRAGSSKAVTNENGEFTLEKMETGDYSLAITKPGYQAVTQDVTVETTDIAIGEIKMQPKAEIDLSQYDYIQSDKMRVYVGKDFPVVAQYQVDYTSDKPLVFQGQSEKINTVLINGTAIVPEVSNVTDVQGSANSKNYTLTLKNPEAKIDLTMTVQISVEGGNLTWQVTNLTKNEGCTFVDTIEVPNLNLLSITDLEAEQAADAQKANVGFAGAKASTVTTQTGDVYIGFADGSGFIPGEKDNYLYGFLTNGQLSAGLWSNSEVEGDKRIQRNNGPDYIALTSSQWYYERGDKGAQKYANAHPELQFPTSELPCTKVSLTADVNNDNQVNWNDGAVAFRQIINIPMGSEVIKDMVNYRIVMNFASMAPNPYLETADNIKKVFLATDGLPQSVMLKGYGNEGHDSANSEYADIAVREGGVEDFQDLIKIAHDYNTEIGVHINAQEAYPESKSFSDRMVSFPQVSNGWGWLDQSHVIDKLWDLTSQNRWSRLVQFYDRINNTNFLTAKWPAVAGSGTVTATMEELAADAAKRPDNMDFIYLDVWYQDAWETRRIAEQINSLGWRFTTEFSAQGEYDSTWQHWSTDAVYGGASMKGYNSDIIRFLRNDQRDSQVLNYPQFGGTADNPLLGGFRLAGFEGWGGDQDFNAYINRTFSENLPTRFLQHYQVIKWENYTGAEGDKSPVGNHEKQITLRDDKNNIVVVTRNEEQREDDIIERTVTLNDTVVLKDGTYLLPWEDNQGEGTKLYHWNQDGGKTTWQLTGDFAGAKSLVLYELSDQGRINPKTVMVNNGQIELDAKAQTAYILVKSPNVKKLANDFGEKDYVVDPGFNGYAENSSLDKKEWSGDINNSSVKIKKATTGDQNLVFSSTGKAVSVSTEISGLKKGEHYVAEIYVDNKSDSKATVSVNTGTKTESNYTYRSIAGNYVKCDEGHLANGYDSKLQWIQVPFVAEKDTATFTLQREAGKGDVIWDDIRIVNIKLENKQADGSFKQDFESVVQGLYPFVLGPAQDVSDPVTHLSQKHDPFTQSGWHTKILDDVIGGEWSLKHHGNNRGIIYQTIPQNFRFEPGKVYEVSFDYQSGPNGAYAMVVGDGASFNMPAGDGYFASTAAPAPGQKSTTGHHTMLVTGAASGQTWIGLYNNGNAGDNAMGGRDFILDNLEICQVGDEKVGVTISVTKNNLYKGETATLTGTSLDKVTFTNSDPDVASFDEETKTIKALNAGTTTITATMKGKEAATTASVTITVADRDIYDVRTKETKIVAQNNSQEGYGAENILDKNAGSNWDGTWNEVTKDAPAKAVIDLGKETELSGFRFAQRSAHNVNGMIQGYRYVIGNKFDEKTGTITDGQVSEWITVDNPHGGQWVDQRLNTNGKNVSARYIQIEVYGSNNNATMSEFAPYVEKMVSTTATVEDTTVFVGQSKALEAVAPENTLLKGLVWSTENSDLIAVTKEGVMTGLKEGTATVTVTNAAGLKATGKVTVLPAPADPLPDTMTLAEEISISNQIDLDKYEDGAEKDAFVKALNTAKEIQNNPQNYTQNDVDTAKVVLTSARLALKEKPPIQLPDITKLTEEIRLSSMIDLSKYEDGAEKDAFVKALNAAKEIQNNLGNYTQQQVDTATENLKNARLALKEKTPINPDKPVDPNNPVNPNNPTPAPNPSAPTVRPQTGDGFNAIIWVVVLLVSAGCVVGYVVIKKKQNKH